MGEAQRRHLISLGTRCDVAFQLRMHSGDNTAHFFDWLALPTPGLIHILERDFDVFAPEDLEYCGQSVPGYVMDRPTGTRFHHQFPFKDGRVDSDFLRSYDPFIAKFRHLAQRFRDYMHTRPVTLVRRDISAAAAVQLEELVMARYPGADVQFLYLRPNGDLFQTKLGRARYLQGSRSVGEPLVSAQMFKEEGLIETPFRLSSLDIFGPREEGYNLSTDNRLTVEELDAAMEINPGNPGFAFELARHHRSQGRWDQALTAIAKARDVAPDNAVVAAEELRIRWGLKQVEGSDYIRGLARLVGDSDPAEVAKTAGNGLSEMGDFEAAARCYAVYVRQHPGEVGLMFASASCLAKLERWEAVEHAASCGLAIVPDDLRGRILRSRAYAALGRLDEALDDALKACALKRSHDTRYHLADIYEQRGEASKAIETYEAIERIGTAVNGKAIERLAVLRLTYEDPADAKPARKSWLASLFGR